MPLAVNAEATSAAIAPAEASSEEIALVAMLAQRVRPGPWSVAVTWTTLGRTRSAPKRSTSGCSFSIPFWSDIAARGVPAVASSASAV